MANLDDRQEGVLKTFGREALEEMSLEDVVRLVGEAGPGAKFHGKAVVKRADGSIKYDSDATPGEFGETSEELVAHAEKVANEKIQGAG